MTKSKINLKAIEAVELVVSKGITASEACKITGASQTYVSYLLTRYLKKADKPTTLKSSIWPEETIEEETTQKIFTTMNVQNIVKEFQNTSGDVKFNESLRRRLLFEELDELKLAIKQNNKVEMLDAICDLHYINAGTANLVNKKYHEIRNQDSNATVDSIIQRISLVAKQDITRISVIATAIFEISLKLGFTDRVVEEAFLRVHRSNMGKFPKTLSEAEKTVEKYQKEGVKCRHEKTGGLYVILRNDGKILKSVNYKPVNLEDLV